MLAGETHAVGRQALAEQVWPAVQVPQSTVPPQPSEIVPHFCDGAQVPGVQQVPRVLLGEYPTQTA
jgi:hypothetical protein